MITVIDILETERAWKSHLNKLDGGSYCESAEPAHSSSCKVINALRVLCDVMLAHERSGHAMPK